MKFSKLNFASKITIKLNILLYNRELGKFIKTKRTDYVQIFVST